MLADIPSAGMLRRLEITYVELSKLTFLKTHVSIPRESQILCLSLLPTTENSRTKTFKPSVISNHSCIELAPASTLFSRNMRIVRYQRVLKQGRTYPANQDLRILPILKPNVCRSIFKTKLN